MSYFSGSRRRGTNTGNSSTEDRIQETVSLKNSKKTRRKTEAPNRVSCTVQNTQQLSKGFKNKNKPTIQNSESKEADSRTVRCKCPKACSSTRSRRNSPRVQKSTRCMSPLSSTNRINLRHKSSSPGTSCCIGRFKECKSPTEYPSENLLCESHEEHKLLAERDSINSTGCVSPIRETTEMPCYSEMSTYGHVLIGDPSMQKADKKQCTDVPQQNLSSSLYCSEGENSETDTSYTTCNASGHYEPHHQMISHVETIGDQHSENDVETLKLNLKERVETLLAECEETEMKLLGDDELDEANRVQCNIIQSAKELARIQLQLISFTKDDKLAVQLMQKQIYMLEKVLCHSNQIVNNNLGLKHEFNTLSKGFLALFKHGSVSERTPATSAEIMSQNILNGILFLVAIGVLLYVYQF